MSTAKEHSELLLLNPWYFMPNKKNVCLNKGADECKNSVYKNKLLLSPSLQWYTLIPAVLYFEKKILYIFLSECKAYHPDIHT